MGGSVVTKTIIYFGKEMYIIVASCRHKLHYYLY